MGGFELRNILDRAIKDASVVRIVYHGGSRPGSIRDVRPLWLTADSLRAVDVAAGMDKTFLLTKIEIADADIPTTPPGNPGSVEEAVATKIDELRALGWHVALTRDAVGLSFYFKNGKPQKTERVALTFDKYTGVDVIDLDDDGRPVLREERWESRAPYRVWGREVQAPRSFGNIWRAVALFLEEARQRAPRKSEGDL